MNQFKTLILLAVMTALCMGVGLMLGGRAGMLLALVVAAGMNLFTYWNADKIVLRMHNARQVDAWSAPEFYALVEQLAAQAQLPMPKVYIVDSRIPMHLPRAATLKTLQLRRRPACSKSSTETRWRA